MKGETFQASISGNILSNIPKENIEFFRGKVRVPISYDIEKINNTYYIYAILPYNEETYKLRVNQVYFKENNQAQTLDLEKNFTITNTTAPFNIKPGFFIVTQDLQAVLHNNLNYEVSVLYTLDTTTGFIKVPAQSDKTLVIPTSNFEFTEITYLSLILADFEYHIPTYIIKNESIIIDQNNTNVSINNTTLNITNITQQNQSPINITKPKFFFFPSNIQVTVKPGSYFIYDVNLTNLGNIQTGKITLSISDSLTNYTNISVTEIETIPINRSNLISLKFRFLKPENISGFILASSANFSDKFLLNFNIKEDAATNFSVSQSKRCVEYGGKICEQGLTCNGPVISSSEGFTCCIGDCKQINPPGSSTRNWWILLVVIVVLAFIGLIFWLKVKKPKTTSNQVLQQKTQDFSQRFETNGNLTKV
jgi:hypothetical protein